MGDSLTQIKALLEEASFTDVLPPKVLNIRYPYNIHYNELT